MSFIFKATTITAASVFDTPPDSLSRGGETKSFTAGATTVATPPATSTSSFGSNKPLSFGGFTSPPVQTVGSPGFGSPQTTIEKPGVTGINNSGLGITTSRLGISTSTTSTSGISLTGGLSFVKTIVATTSTNTPDITALRKCTGVMTTTTARDVTPAVTPNLALPVKARKRAGPSNATPELASPVKARKTAAPSNATPELASPVKARKTAAPSNAMPELPSPVKARKRAGPSNATPELASPVKARKTAAPSNATPELASPVKARKTAAPSNAMPELPSPVKARKRSGPSNATPELASPVKGRKRAGPSNATPELASPVKARKTAAPSNATPELPSPVKARKRSGPSNATPELVSPVKGRKRAGPSNATPELASPVQARKRAGPPNATPELASPIRAPKRAGVSIVTPEMTSPVKARKGARPSKGQPEHSKKSRGSLNRTDTDIVNILNDSGSDGEEDSNYFSNSEDDAEVDNLTEDNECMVRNFSKKLRNQIMDSEDEEVEEGTETEQDERSDGVNEASERSTTAASVDTNFSWSKDFTSFAGQQEVYLRVPGPNFSSQDPVHVFQQIWDQEFMETLVSETNLYAWQTISQLSDPDIGTGIPSYLDGWTDVTVGELYRYFAILIFFSFCYRSSVKEYWSTGTLEMSDFRKIMSRNRFILIQKFLHFVSNGNLLKRGYDRKIEKIAPVVDHCNRKFAALYTPSQYLSLDESLLLWKGRLSWKQCIRSKAARFGIKTFELCEALTGYLLQFRLYTGKRVEMHPDAIHGFQDHTSKIVLDLMDGYLDVGHVLVMDNWYNQLPLTRYLKSRHTDVLGTIKRQRRGVPDAISSLDPNGMKRGKTVGRHSGDMTLVAWKDVKLVTIISTYHQHLMVSARRAGEEFQKPIAVEDYNRYMGGVDRKDQKLSMFLMERKRGLKWYMKVFKRLFNTSLLNAYIIYSRSPMHQVLTHRDFRFKVAEGLLSRYPLEFPAPSTGPVTRKLPYSRLQPGKHFPVYMGRVSGHRNERKRLRCIRCSANNQRVTVTTLCELCQVPLCLGKCWKEYHTVLNFTK